MARTDPLGLIGTTIAEKYAIESVVGEGGFAIVYKATHALWKRPVAVKVFKALGEVPDEDRERLLQEFVREGALLAELSERSAAIVQARDVGTVKARNGEHIPYMVLEWLEGATLESVLEKERKSGIPPRAIEEAVRLLEPAAFALSLAHSKGIAHRDVKPANVFVLGNPRSHDAAVKILDFGIAKVVQDVQKVGGAFSKTSGQVTSFTPLYGAPEQFNRSYGATGPWTDVFALALVTMELVTGKEGLEGDDIVQLAFASANPTRRPTPRTYGATVSDPVEAVFAKALSVKTDERYATAGDFWNALREAIGMSAMPKARTSLTGNEISTASTQLAAAGLKNTGGGPVRISDPGPVMSTTGPQALTGVNTTGSRVSVPGLAPAPQMGDAVNAAPIVPSKGHVGTAWIILGVTLLVALGLAWWAFAGLGGGGSGSNTPAPSASGDAAVAAASGSSHATPASAAAAIPAVPAIAPGACPGGMVKVPGGDFFMGSDEKTALANEKPAHPVHVDAYCLDETEVTVGAYNACTIKGGCKRTGKENDWTGISDREKTIFDPLCNDASLDAGDRTSLPMNCVSWEEARNFCIQQGNDVRLPTEAEWEFAARGPEQRLYPWGDDPPSAKYLNACGKECAAWETAQKLPVAMMYPEDDGFPATAPVKSFPGGMAKFGNYDMVGNVWEWVADVYEPYAKGSGGGPRAMNPQGPAEGKERVIRGGAFNGSTPAWVRPQFRYYDEPVKKSYGIGFRCARTVK